MRVKIVFLLCGFMAGVLAEATRCKLRQQAQEIQPLTVTVLDDGGAKLKVKTCVEQDAKESNKK